MNHNRACFPLVQTEWENTYTNAAYAIHKNFQALFINFQMKSTIQITKGRKRGKLCFFQNREIHYNEVLFVDYPYRCQIKIWQFSACLHQQTTTHQHGWSSDMKQCIFALTTAHLVQKNISYFSYMPLGSIWRLIQSNVFLGIHTVNKTHRFTSKCNVLCACMCLCMCVSLYIYKARERKVPVHLSEIGYRLQIGSHSEWTVFTVIIEVLDATHQGMWKISRMPP